MSEVANKPSVLMVGPSLTSRGGMATVEKQLVDCLPKEGIDVDFLSTYEDAGKMRKALVALKAYFAFCRRIDRYDIVHVHMASRASYERKAIFARRALKNGKKVIIHHHGGEFGIWFDGELSAAKQREVRSLFANADKVIVLSEEWLSWFHSRGFCIDSFVVMHNAVPVPAKPCSPCSHQDVLFLGRLDSNKSPDVLLRASKAMLEANPDASLLFGGDGFVERYETLARELGIEQRCEFLGWITGEDKERLFHRAGIYCLPSKNEGMPMSVLEAMAHGLPVIATPVGGVPRLISNNTDGFIVPVDDVNRLSQILVDLAGNPARRATVGATARKKIVESFNLDDNIKALGMLYRKLMQL